MHKKIANDNMLLKKFNERNNSTNNTPFHNNDLINKNVNVRNNLDAYARKREMFAKKNQAYIQTKNDDCDNSEIKHDIIHELLKPEIFSKEDPNRNADVHKNYDSRNQLLNDFKNKKEVINITNVPYKIILKDKIITKKVDEVTLEDLIVHKIVIGEDDDINKFMKDCNDKKTEKKLQNNNMDLEYHQSNYNKHKKKFDYKASFITNLAYEENITCKEDCIDFYKRKQKEIEDNLQKCNEISKFMEDQGLLNDEEIKGISGK
jgi:hypothetical protein